jgi:hypothetical protein
MSAISQYLKNLKRFIMLSSKMTLNEKDFAKVSANKKRFAKMENLLVS